MVKGQTHLSQHYQVFVPQWESRKGQGWRAQPFLDLILQARRLSRDLVPFFPRDRTLIMEAHKEGWLTKDNWPALVFSDRTQCVSGTWSQPREQGAIWFWNGKSMQCGIEWSCVGFLTLLISSIVPLSYSKDNTSFLRLFWILYELVHVKAPSSLCDFNKHISVRGLWPLLCLPPPTPMHTLLLLWCYVPGMGLLKYH